MNIQHVEISGFRSFSGQQSFSLDRGPGLFLMKGQNDVDSELGANGVGKSTFWDAIRWCLFGATSRGLKGPKVESWQNSQTSVKVRLEVRGITYTVHRTRNPIRVMLNKKSVAQGTLDELYGMSGGLWDQVFMQGQFGRYFFDMTPADRLDTLSELLDLERWTEAARISAGRQRQIKKDLAQHLRKYSNVEGQLQAGRANLKDRMVFVDKRQADVDNSDEKEQQHLFRLRGLMSDTKGAIEDLEDSLDELAELNVRDAEVEEIRTNIAKCERRYTGMSETRGELRATIRHHADRSAKIQKLEDRCPMCEQGISHNVHDKMAADAARKRKEAELKLQTVDADLRKSDRDLKRHKDQLREILSDIRDAASKVERIKTGIQHHKTQWAGYERDCDSVGSGSVRVRTELAEAQSREDETKAEVSALEQKLREMTAVTHGFNYMIQVITDWSVHFRKIRLFVVERALVQMRSKINSSLTELGLRGWKVDFEVGDLKSIGVARQGFEIMVRSPHSPEKVPWESWSGGETQRLRIAGAVGMADLIATTQGIQTKLEIWDEPTAHLDETGVADLISYMEDRARGDRAIWLVDHRSLSRGAFTGTALVVKTKDGSAIRYSE